MMEPNRAELERVTRSYCDALLRTLTDYYHPGPATPVMSINFHGSPVLWNEELFLTLADAYDQVVPVPFRVAFREAVGDAIRECVHRTDLPPEAYRQLIHLMKTVRAVEALDALLVLVGTTTIADESPMVLYSIMGALGSLVPSRDVARVTGSLIDISGFDDSYLLMGTKLLVQCDPGNASEIVIGHIERVAELRDSAEARGELETFNRIRSRWVEDLVSVAGVTWMVDLWSVTAAGAPHARVVKTIMQDFVEPDSIDDQSIVLVKGRWRRQLLRTDANARLTDELLLVALARRRIEDSPATKGLVWKN